jgi:hypothetical protein
LTEDYHHDYGTICHAVAAAGLAAMWSVSHSPQGGITGFQAGFCMWDIVRQWSYPSNRCGMKILDYDNLLYPQYEDKFFSISKETLEQVQKEARNRIEEHQRVHDIWEKSHAEWKSEMERFKVGVEEWQKQHLQYPTYEENPKFYEHLRCGTSEEWEEENKKEASGFMFAPIEPCEPKVHPDVMEHWKMLAGGAVPFGLRVDD